ncbi:hypothetical protein B0H10DRAFT_1957333 [Mycena sp. CBHHK59/15]|nr:hypothetical protein B0H10DRAFT_1957333 [Mycena sp. CBHHK59/15]
MVAHSPTASIPPRRCTRNDGDDGEVGIQCRRGQGDPALTWTGGTNNTTNPRPGSVYSAVILVAGVPWERWGGETETSEGGGWGRIVCTDSSTPPPPISTQRRHHRLRTAAHDETRVPKRSRVHTRCCRDRTRTRNAATTMRPRLCCIFSSKVKYEVWKILWMMPNAEDPPDVARHKSDSEEKDQTIPVNVWLFDVTMIKSPDEKCPAKKANKRSAHFYFELP